MEKNLTEAEVEKPEVGKEQTETAPDSSTEQKTETTTPPQEGEQKTDNTPDEENLPFHKHPRWKQMYEENKGLKQTVEELMAFKQQVEPLAKAMQPQQETPIPEWFKSTYGDNPLIWKQYQTYDKSAREEIKKELLSEIKAEETQKTQETQKWNKWVEESLVGMEDEGLKFNRNELQKFMVDWQKDYGALPLDKDGNIDFRKSLELMNKVNPPLDSAKVAEEKKRIAAKTSSTGGNISAPKKILTLGNIPKDWRDAV